MISVTELDRLLAGLDITVEEVEIPLEQSIGQCLRKPLVADRDMPPFDRVMMDGYAIAGGTDFARPCSVVGIRSAGDSEAQPLLGPQDVIEIMTGASLPAGCDTVVPYEVVKEDAEGLHIPVESTSIGQFIHARGSDYRQGDTVVPAGRRVRSVEVGIAASLGYSKVSISQTPKIGLVATGNELVPIGSIPKAGQIRQSNIHAMEAALKKAGFPPAFLITLTDEGIVEEKRLESLLSKVDVLIISGAVSKGKKDWIAPALNRLGNCLAHGVAQRPGKPMGVWNTSEGAVVFGLPGNPVSSLVGLHRHVLPWLREKVGCPQFQGQSELASGFAFPKPLTLFLPVSLNPEGKAVPVPTQNSGDYGSLTKSDGFLELPENEDQFEAGRHFPYFSWL